MNYKIKLQLITILLIAGFYSYGDENAKLINSYPVYIQNFASLNSHMKIIKLTNSYPDHFIVYNNNNYDLNPKLEEKIIFNGNIAEINFDKLTAIIKYDYIVKCKSNKITLSVRSGPLPPLDELQIVFVNNREYVTGASFCLLYPTVFYSFHIQRGHSFSEPGYIKKFKFKNEEISEIEQPYYKLDFITKANVSLKIYQSQQEKDDDQVGTLADGSDIHVLGYKKTDNDKWYLLEGKTGIIGWHKLYLIKREEVYKTPEYPVTTETYSLAFMDKKYGPEG